MASKVLSAVAAQVQDLRSRTERNLANIRKQWQNHGLFNGQDRRYAPADEDGQRLPSESKLCGADAQRLLAEAYSLFEQQTNYYQALCEGNRDAIADVEVRGTVILKDAPITLLLELPAKLHDIRTACESIPTLPTDRKWTWNADQGCYEAAEEASLRTNKVETFVTVTDNQVIDGQAFEAQVKSVTKDVPVGTWYTRHSSKAIPVVKKEKLLRAIDDLLAAVKTARQNANASTHVTIGDAGKRLVDWLDAQMED